MSEHNSDSAGYETKDVNITKIVMFGLGGIALLVIIVVFVFDVFTTGREEAVYNAVLKPGSPALRELHAHEAEFLFSYGVVDATKGVYRIPIDRAIGLMAEEAFERRSGKSARGK